jgi:hypothetical protein
MADKRRTGAPTWARVILIACKMSHFPGFWAGLTRISNPTFVTTIQPLWEAVCVAVEAYVSTDDYPFERDATTGSETQDGL